ncbi:MAG: DUF4160 domain-containing protein [Saprospiraceae bacterium]|jgi:hypothetical protein|nr:DUF4160 domain-containing protein [Saprospiraceae bacterium]
MPQISKFFGIIICMYYDDHNPPHFHAFYGDYSAIINIYDYSVMEGKLPGRALGLVVEWASIHSQELLINWDRAINGIQLLKIDPLE